MVSYNDYPEESFDNSFNTEALEGAKSGFTGNLGMEESYSLEIRFVITSYSIHYTKLYEGIIPYMEVFDHSCLFSCLL